MNRAQRRAEMKAQRGVHYPAYMGLTKQKMLEELVKNGITLDDMKKEYQKGYNAGFHDGSDPVIKTCYAAVLLALHEEQGMDKDRCVEILNQVDRHILTSLSSMDAIDDVYSRLGVELDFGEVLEDRVREGKKHV